MRRSQLVIDDKPHANRFDGGDTRVVWVDSLYTQLVQAVSGSRQRERTGVRASRPPVWVDALDQLRAIDDTVAQWEPMQPTTETHDSTPVTVARLSLLQQRGWRPQDTTLIDGYTATIQSWCDRIRDLLSDKAKWSLPNPCPACGTKVIYRQDSGGEVVRRAALQIGEHGCECAQCHHIWEPALFTHLARVLGYGLPEGVLE